jgi:Flp pilus assembly protein TadD
MYCGSDIVVREAVKLAGGPSIENLMALAKDGESTSNFSEAYDYYTRVLEYDVNNWEAWVGKGISGLLGKGDIYVGQYHNNINSAIKLVPNKDLVKQKLLSIINLTDIYLFNKLSKNIGQILYDIDNKNIL